MTAPHPARRNGSLSRLRGILCPACGTGTSRVIDSREQAGTVRRRRECVRCGGRWTTEERPISFSPAREGKRR